MSGRGEGWVIAQFAVMGAILVAGFAPPSWPESVDPALAVLGAVLALGGGAFAVWAGRTLGKSLTPFPKPVEAGLVTTGPFRIVRHPIYTGGLLFFTGYSLFASVPALVLTAGLGILWAGKIRVEERLLAEVYDGYAAYCRSVPRRLLPFLY